MFQYLPTHYQEKKNYVQYSTTKKLRNTIIVTNTAHISYAITYIILCIHMNKLYMYKSTAF